MGNKIQVSAHMKIRPGKLEEFKRQAAVMIAQTKAKDPGTLQYDWFVSNDKMECEVREAYESPEALMAHVENISEPRDALFEKYATDHFMVFYGDAPEILKKAAAMGVKAKAFSYLQGLT